MTALGSGMNYYRKGLTSLINKLLDNNVKRLVLTHKDRLLRFGAELIFFNMWSQRRGSGDYQPGRRQGFLWRRFSKGCIGNNQRIFCPSVWKSQQKEPKNFREITGKREITSQALSHRIRIIANNKFKTYCRKASGCSRKAYNRGFAEAFKVLKSLNLPICTRSQNMPRSSRLYFLERRYPDTIMQMIESTDVTAAEIKWTGMYRLQ